MEPMPYHGWRKAPRLLARPAGATFGRAIRVSIPACKPTETRPKMAFSENAVARFTSSQIHRDDAGQHQFGMPPRHALIGEGHETRQRPTPPDGRIARPRHADLYRQHAGVETDDFALHLEAIDATLWPPIHILLS